VSYPLADYAKMAPTNGTATLPVTFTYTLASGSIGATPAVIATNIAGNDPAWWLKPSMATSQSWNGVFGGKGGKAVLGTKYWWGVWQDRQNGSGTLWNEESLLFPITFQ